MVPSWKESSEAGPSPVMGREVLERWPRGWLIPLFLGLMLGMKLTK